MTRRVFAGLLALMLWTLPVAGQTGWSFGTVAEWGDPAAEMADLLVLDVDGDWDAASSAAVDLAVRVSAADQLTPAQEIIRSGRARAVVVPAELLADAPFADSVRVIAVRTGDAPSATDLAALGADWIWGDQLSAAADDGFYLGRVGQSRVILSSEHPEGVRWILSPGPIALPPGHAWTDVQKKALAFRAARAAVTDGMHEAVSTEPYAFYRGVRLGADQRDEAVVVLGASGKVRLNVARVLPDDVVLRDAITGAIGMVSYGQVTFSAGESGVLLLEVLQ